MSQIPCPNPICTQNFTPSEIQKSGGALTCPSCGQTFHFGSGPVPMPPAPAKAPAPKPTKPSAGSWLSNEITPKNRPKTKPTPPSTPVPPSKPKTPLASPIEPTESHKLRREPSASVPLAEPIESEDAGSDLGDEFFNPASASSAPLIRSLSASSRSTWTWKKFAVIGGVGGILFALSYLFIPRFYRYVTGDGLMRGTPYTGYLRNQKGSEEKFVRIIVPEGGWEADQTLKDDFKAQLAVFNHQNGREAWIAIGAVDFGGQLPSDGELQREAIQRLQNRFQSQYEFQSPTSVSFLGEKAMSIGFRGQAKEVAWVGECVTFGHHGFGYWFFFAAPRDEELKSMKAEITPRLELLTGRKGWRPRNPDYDRFTSNSKRVIIDAPKDRWIAYDPTEEFDKADLGLHSKKSKEADGNIQNNAIVTVVMMEQGGDLNQTLKLAQDYFQTKLSTEFKIEADGPSRMEELADRRAVTGEYRLAAAGDSLKFYRVTVIHDNDRAFVFRFECGYRTKEVWTADFRDVLAGVSLARP